LVDSARLEPRAVIGRLGALLRDPDPLVRINALRALASYADSGAAHAVAPLLTDADPGVVVQAETTLGALGGGAAVSALQGRLTSAVFAVKRQAVIGLAEAAGAAGLGAADALASDPDWRWRSVAAEAFGASDSRSEARTRLDALLDDPDGRVVALALQALGRVEPDSDEALLPRARALLAHADPAVRSVAADLLARHPDPEDVDPLVQAYLRAAHDPFNNARLSALAALARIAGASAAGRLGVASRFLGTVPRSEDYLVRRLAAERLPDAAGSWGPVGPIVTGRGVAEYRDIARRWLAPALAGRPAPRLTIDTDRGSLVIELLPSEAPLTVAAFLALIERRFFDRSRWHRVVPNFVVQDGDPRGDGWGGPGFVLRDEVNPARYETGTMGMALDGPDTGGSQFFITHSPQPHLDGIYTVFGRVVQGTPVLAAIAQGERIRSIHR
ncbi:MAG: peptidylprolyl isomerase, partial [Gemmatimonadales bacterium]